MVPRSVLLRHARGVEGGHVTQRPRRALHQRQGQQGTGALAEAQPQVHQRALRDVATFDSAGVAEKN